MDMIVCSEAVYMPELQKLKDLGDKYPVTLVYLPLKWMSDAITVAVDMFGKCPTQTLKFTNFFSSQHESVIKYITEELKKDSPTLRLVFCTSLRLGWALIHLVL